MASVMLATYPEVFAGGAIIAGLAYGSASTIPEAFDRMRGHGGPSEQVLKQLLHDASQHNGPWPKISIWQGLADATVVPSNADAIAAQWRSVHGLGRTPSFSETIDSRTKRSWLDEEGRRSDRDRDNCWHGARHAAQNERRRGPRRSAPFILDVGISSTRQIAQFWGIANATINMAAEPRQDDDAGNRRLSYPVLVSSTPSPHRHSRLSGALLRYRHNKLIRTLSGLSSRTHCVRRGCFANRDTLWELSSIEWIPLSGGKDFMNRKLDLRTGAPVWTAYRSPRVSTNRLMRDVKCDVVVVGLGISGAMIIEALTAQGLSVVGLTVEVLCSGRRQPQLRWCNSRSTTLLTRSPTKSVEPMLSRPGGDHGLQCSICAGALQSWKSTAISNEAVSLPCGERSRPRPTA